MGWPFGIKSAIATRVQAAVFDEAAWLPRQKGWERGFSKKGVFAGSPVISLSPRTPLLLTLGLLQPGRAVPS